MSCSLLLDTRGLFNNVWGVWFLWRMSFIPGTQLRIWCRTFKVASSCCLISNSSLFLSFRPPSRATLQLWPHFLWHFLPPADTKRGEHCATQNWLSSVDLFFFFLPFWSSNISETRLQHRQTCSLAVSVCGTGCELNLLLNFSYVFVSHVFRLAWKRVRDLHLAVNCLCKAMFW